MSSNPSHLYYTPSHEWVSALEDGVITVGITEHAQSMLGDIVFVELPEVGQSVEKGKEIMVLESVKAAADVYAPLSGEVVEVNASLSDSPEQVNQAPYESGWLFKLKLQDDSALSSLMSAADYQASL